MRFKDKTVILTGSSHGVGKGIRVNCVGPGLIATGATFRVFTQEMVDGMGAMIPLGRIGEAQDVSNACIFLVLTEINKRNGS